MSEKSYRIVFAGTPDFAARHLAALIDSQHQVVAVYSQPDRPAGRGKKLQASAVKQTALEHNLEVYQPSSLKSSQAAEQMAALNADILVVVAYGLILPKSILELPKFGCINVHGSLLPKWRGAAPVQRAIWAGDKITGITTMLMDEGLDTGDMLLKKEIPIEASDTSLSLFEKMAHVGPQALLETLDSFASITPVAQVESEASYAKKLDKKEAVIDWQLPGEQIDRNIRAFTPWPGTQLSVAGQMVKVIEAELTEASSEQHPGTILSADKNGILIATGTRNIQLRTLQIPGKKAMPVSAVLQSKGEWFKPGNKLLSEH
ncbi:MAG: methionyl-tRNA formyltransferase [Aestuariibacter sp.]